MAMFVPNIISEADKQRFIKKVNAVIGGLKAEIEVRSEVSTLRRKSIMTIDYAYETISKAQKSRRLRAS